MIRTDTNNISDFEVGATGYGHENVTVARRAATSLNKHPESSHAGLDSSLPIGASDAQSEKVNPRPKSVLGLVRVGGREEELDPFSVSQVSSYRVIFSSKQMIDALKFNMSCEL